MPAREMPVGLRRHRIAPPIADLFPVRELDRELAERALARGELGLTPVVRDVCCGLGCGALVTEVVGVRLRSVVAALLGRRDGREQLALLP